MTSKLGEESIKKLTWSIAIPSMIGQFVNVLYSIVDRIYVGHLKDIGSVALAGIGICGPVVTMISAFASLIGVGGGPLCAIAMGEKNDEKAKKYISNAFILLIIISLLLIMICYPISEKMLMIFGASSSTIKYANDYFRIYLLGTPFALLSVGMNNFITCQGKSKLGMASVLIGAITNIILDPVFMFIFNMGVKGAALASIIGQLFSCIFVLLILFSNKLEVNLRIHKLEKDKCLEIIKIGFTQFIIIAFDNVMIIAMNAILQKYGGELGDLYVSVNTILQSFMLILTMPLSGISSGTQCILSYNFGALKMDRVKEAIRYISKVCVCYCILMFIIVWLFGKYFIVLFNNDVQIVEYTLKAMRIYTLFIIPLGLQYEMVDGMTGLGQVKISLTLSFFRKGIYFIALFLLPKYFGVMSTFFAEAISDLIPPIVSYIIVSNNIDHILEWRLFNHENI